MPAIGRQDARALLWIAGIVLAGYWGVFQGADFFVEEDPVTVFTYAQGNAAGNGWRPDKALGTSFFFGDPGMFHAWSPLALLSRPFGSGRAFYTWSVVVLLIAAAWAQYYLLKRVAPRLGTAAWLLAPLAVFGAVQHELLFQRHWIALSIATPLLILLLDDFLERPRHIYLAYAALLFWFTWFFGSAASFIQALIVGALFAVVRTWLSADRWRCLGRFTTLYAAGVAGTVLLGASAFYSLIVERQLGEYVRASNYLPVLSLLDARELARALPRLLHSGLFDTHLATATLNGVFAWTQSWTNVSPLFPAVLLLVVARRSIDRWTATLKWMLLALLANELLYAGSPAYNYAIQQVWGLYPVQKFQPAYYCLQVGLIAIVLADLSAPDRRFADAADAARSRRLVASGLGLVYGALAVFAAISIVAPDSFETFVLTIFDRVAPSAAAGFPKATLREAAAFDLGQLMASMRWPVLAFYGVVAAVMITWSRRPALLSVSRGSVTGFAALLLGVGMLLSWGIYPLNRQPLAWDRGAAAVLSPTDRVYVFFDPRLQAIERTAAAFRREWIDGEFGRAEYRIGHLNSPALNLSGPMSFWPREQAELVDRAFREGGAPLPAMRNLAFGPFAPSPWLDMAAVSHFVSFRPLPDRVAYPLAYKEKGIYLYRNPSAWPYFYLADRVEAVERVADLPTPQPGTAYVSAGDVRPLDATAPGSRVRLTAFSPGRMAFDFDGRRDEFLTIADGWHPFWRARVDTAPIEVVKANVAFKGAWIPAGRHVVEFYFDTAPFTPGLYISAAAWSALAASMAWSMLRSRRRRPLLAAESMA